MNKKLKQKWQADDEYLKKVKYRLTGRRFKLLLAKKGVKKYEIHKALKISYRTLSMWQNESAMPSDRLAIEVGKYLGLIAPEEATLIGLKKEVEELERRIKLIDGDNESRI